jgi:hypothetical protein
VAYSASLGWVQEAFACTCVGTSSGWRRSVAAPPPEATPVNRPDRLHDAYVRGLRHGFVAALWAAMALAAIAVLIYATAHGVQ